MPELLNLETPESTMVKHNIQRSIMREIRYCAFIVYDPVDKKRYINYIYKVISARLIKRENIDRLQSGAQMKAQNQGQYYWLFELGEVNKLKSSIDVSVIRKFKPKLSTLDELVKATDWNNLPNHYSFLQKT